MEDVVEQMRKEIGIELAKNGSLEIHFSYPDRDKAQKIVSEIGTRLLDASLREASVAMHSTGEVLHSSLETAAAEWADLSQKARAAGASERLLLDRDLAKKQYVDASAKLADFQLGDEMEKRRLGSYLELLDTASLPERPDSSPYARVAIFTLGGLAIGIIARLAADLWFPALPTA